MPVSRACAHAQVIIMLPAHVNLILLSATVPNVMEFADWVGRTKRKRLHVTGHHAAAGAAGAQPGLQRRHVPHLPRGGVPGRGAVPASQCTPAQCTVP